MVRRYIYKRWSRPMPNRSGPVRTMRDLSDEERQEWIRQAAESRNGRPHRYLQFDEPTAVHGTR
jgi:hypothetical protein